MRTTNAPFLGTTVSIEDNAFDFCYIGAVEVDDRKPAAKPTPVPMNTATATKPKSWKIPPVTPKPAPAPSEAVVMDESEPPVVYPQKGPGFAP
jgi:hypothetical protein